MLIYLDLCFNFNHGLSCSCFNKTCKRFNRVSKSCKTTDKGYPRFVEEKISKQKSRLMTFGRVESDFLVC